MNNIPQPFKKERRNTKLRSLFDAVRPVALHEDEKSRIRMSLNAFTLRYPVRSESIERGTHARVPFFVALMRMMPAMATLGVALLIGGSISANAEGALPGDNLYSVKLAVNERVRGFFTPSVEGKAEWEMSLAMRRLDEAERLAVANKLTPDISTDLAKNIQKYSGSILARTATMTERDQELAALTLTTKLHASLRTHERILRAFVGTAEASVLADTVKAEANVAAARQSVNNEHLLGDHQSLAVRATNAGTASYNALLTANLAIENRKTMLGGALAKAAEITFTEASASYDAGKTALAANNYADAFLAFQRAFQQAEEAKLLVTIQGNFNLILQDGGQ